MQKTSPEGSGRVGRKTSIISVLAETCAFQVDTGVRGEEEVNSSRELQAPLVLQLISLGTRVDQLSAVSDWVQVFIASQDLPFAMGLSYSLFQMQRKGSVLTWIVCTEVQVQ